MLPAVPVLRITYACVRAAVHGTCMRALHMLYASCCTAVHVCCAALLRAHVRTCLAAAARVARAFATCTFVYVHAAHAFVAAAAACLCAHCRAARFAQRCACSAALPRAPFLFYAFARARAWRIAAWRQRSALRARAMARARGAARVRAFIYAARDVHAHCARACAITAARRLPPSDMPSLKMGSSSEEGSWQDLLPPVSPNATNLDLGLCLLGAVFSAPKYYAAIEAEAILPPLSQA